MIARDVIAEELFDLVTDTKDERVSAAASILSAFTAAGYAVVERPALGVQPDDDASGLYLRYRTGAERDAAASALTAAAKETPDGPCRYLSPAEVAALRAERDAAVAKCERMTEHAQRRDQRIRAQRAALRQKQGQEDNRKFWLGTIAARRFMRHREKTDREIRAELTTLRAEVARLRAALVVVSQGLDTFHISPIGGKNIFVDGGDRFAHERDVERLLAVARAALEPKP